VICCVVFIRCVGGVVGGGDGVVLSIYVAFLREEVVQAHGLS